MDYTLFRRFDDVIEYALPDKSQIQKLLENKLAGFAEKDIEYKESIKIAEEFSFAEISHACENAIKEMIIGDRPAITGKSLERMIEQRKKYHSRIVNNYPKQR